MKLKVNKENYKKLIELCDYLMIDNSDKLIDKIVEIHNYEYSIIYEFKNFYKYNSKRLVAFNNKEELEKAIQLFNKDHIKSYYTYGFTSFWDVSNVTNMSSIFRGNQFNGDISNWDVSNVTNMSYMFFDSKFNKDISNWNVSNVTNMRGMFIGSQFKGDIYNWNVVNINVAGGCIVINNLIKWFEFQNRIY